MTTRITRNLPGESEALVALDSLWKQHGRRHPLVRHALSLYAQGKFAVIVALTAV